MAQPQPPPNPQLQPESAQPSQYEIEQYDYCGYEELDDGRDVLEEEQVPNPNQAEFGKKNDLAYRTSALQNENEQKDYVMQDDFTQPSASAETSRFSEQIGSLLPTDAFGVPIVPESCDFDTVLLLRRAHIGTEGRPEFQLAQHEVVPTVSPPVADWSLLECLPLLDSTTASIRTGKQVLDRLYEMLLIWPCDSDGAEQIVMRLMQSSWVYWPSKPSLTDRTHFPTLLKQFDLIIIPPSPKKSGIAQANIASAVTDEEPAFFTFLRVLNLCLTKMSDTNLTESTSANSSPSSSSSLLRTATRLMAYIPTEASIVLANQNSEYCQLVAIFSLQLILARVFPADKLNDYHDRLLRCLMWEKSAVIAKQALVEALGCLCLHFQSRKLKDHLRSTTDEIFRILSTLFNDYLQKDGELQIQLLIAETHKVTNEIVTPFTIVGRERLQSIQQEKERKAKARIDAEQTQSALRKEMLGIETAIICGLQCVGRLFSNVTSFGHCNEPSLIEHAFMNKILDSVQRVPSKIRLAALSTIEASMVEAAFRIPEFLLPAFATQNNPHAELSPSDDEYLAMLEDAGLNPETDNPIISPERSNITKLTAETANQFLHSYIATLCAILYRICTKLLELIRARFAKGSHHLNPPVVDTSSISTLIPISTTVPSNSAKALTSAIDLYYNIDSPLHPDFSYCIDNDVMLASIRTVAKMSPLLVYTRHKSWLHFQASFGSSSDWIVHSANQSHLSSLYRSIPLEYYTSLLSLSYPALLQQMVLHPPQTASLVNLWLLSMFEPSFTLQHRFTSSLFSLSSQILPFDPPLPQSWLESSSSLHDHRLLAIHYLCRGVDYAFRSTCDASLANEPPSTFAPRLQRIKEVYSSYFVRLTIVLPHIKNQMISESVAHLESYVNFMYCGLCSVIRHSLFILESDSSTSMLSEFIKTFFLDIEIPLATSSLPTLATTATTSSPSLQASSIFLTYNAALHCISTLIHSLSSLNFASPTPSRARMLAQLFARYFVVIQTRNGDVLSAEAARLWSIGMLGRSLPSLQNPQASSGPTVNQQPGVVEHAIEAHVREHERPDDASLSQHQLEIAYLRQYFMKFILSFYIMKVIALEQSDTAAPVQAQSARNTSNLVSLVYSRASQSTELYVRICTAMAARTQSITSSQKQSPHNLLSSVYNLNTYISEYRWIGQYFSYILTFKLAFSKYPYPCIKMKSAAYRTLRLLLLSSKYFSNDFLGPASSLHASIGESSAVACQFISFILKCIEYDLLQMSYLDSPPANISSIQSKLQQLQTEVLNHHLKWLEMVHPSASIASLPSTQDPVSHLNRILKFLPMPPAEVINVLDRSDELIALTSHSVPSNGNQSSSQTIQPLPAVTRVQSRDLLSSMFNCLEYIFRSSLHVFGIVFSTNSPAGPIVEPSPESFSHRTVCVEWCISYLHPLLESIHNLSFQHMFNQWLVKLPASNFSETTYHQLQSLKFNINTKPATAAAVSTKPQHIAA